jgi:ABC-type nitrate/sulfonate/bicarbonate transport system substrate-binding protein
MASKGPAFPLVTVLLLLLGCGSGAPPAVQPAASSGAVAPSQPAPAAPSRAEVSAPPAPVTVQYGQVGISAAQWIIMAAEATGLLEREAVQLDKLVVPTSNAIVQALSAGSLELGLSAPDPMILAVEQGAALTIVAGGYNRLVYQLVVQPEITSAQGLVGKSVGVSGVKASDALILHRMLGVLGLAPSDYDLLVASTSNDRLAALKSGSIAGTVLIQPLDFQAVDDGFRVLARSTEAVRDYQFSVLFAPQTWVRENEATLVRVLRAYGKAARWLHEPANKEQAIQILAEATKSRPEYARQTYELYVEQVGAMTPDGSVNLPGMQAVIDVLGESEALTPPLPAAAKFVDESYLQMAQAR